jgi:phage shock protein A
MKIIARLRNLLGGLLSQWVGKREQGNPEAVYESAIRQRLAHYIRLRQAAAGVLYMRGKLSGELKQRSADLTRLRRELDSAVERDEDAVALVLINRKAGLEADLERLTQDVREVTAEAEAAKRNLIAFRNDIVELRDEKVRMLAKWASAKARRGFQETLNGLMSTEVDISALAEVREHINRLVAEVQLSREFADAELEQRLTAIRDAEAEASARTQLRELKRARKRDLLPIVLPAAS